MSGVGFSDDCVYDTRVEIFIALQDACSYSKGSRMPEFVSPPKMRDQQIIVYWKPPGSLDWVEKCRTEVVSGKLNLQFVTKVYLDLEARDIASTHLKFDIGHADLVTSLGHKELSRWSTAEVSLDKLITSGARGMQLVLPLILEPTSKDFDSSSSKLLPGSLFLRAERLCRPSLGFAVQFGVEAESPATCNDYYIEFCKLNQEMLLDIPNPYTLIYRSDLGRSNMDDLSFYCGKPVYFLESRVMNSDMNRVLKIEVYKKQSHSSKGYVHTTMGSLMKEGLQVIPVERVEPNAMLNFCQSSKNVRVILKMCNKIPLKRLPYYLNKGLRMFRIYTVDYSRSNWDVALHSRVLHDTETTNPYQEALEVVAKVMRDVAAGESVFYSFGNTKESYVATFPEHKHLRSLLQNYQAALCSEMIGALELLEVETQTSSEGSNSSSQTHHSHSHSVSRTQRFPSSSSSRSHSRSFHILNSNKAQLSPVLEDIYALMTSRNSSFEYFTVFICTDGQIADIDKSIEMLSTLSSHPVSIIIIAIGSGNLDGLLTLENFWSHPTRGKFRKIVRVIHFRSTFDWNTSLINRKTSTHPFEIFRKEVMTSLRDQALGYFRIYHPEL